MPYFPILEVSTVVGCRMACDYCPQSTHARAYANRGDKVMTLETFKTCLDRVPSRVQVMFAGMAEPWLNPDATSMVEEASIRGHAISIYSTLKGMTVEDVERLTKIKLEHLCIHLPDADGIMKLVPNVSWLETLSAVRAKLKHHFVVYGKLHPVARAALGFDVRDDSPGLLSRAGNLPSSMVKKTGKITCTACGPKIDHNVLLPNGDVAMCCMIYDLKHVLGNLTSQDWDSLFTGDEYLRVMRGMNGDETVDLACRSCEMSSPA